MTRVMPSVGQVATVIGVASALTVVLYLGAASRSLEYLKGTGYFTACEGPCTMPYQSVDECYHEKGQPGGVDCSAEICMTSFLSFVECGDPVQSSELNGCHVRIDDDYMYRITVLYLADCDSTDEEWNLNTWGDGICDDGNFKHKCKPQGWECDDAGWPLNVIEESGHWYVCQWME